jgi:hypothetical protein
MTLAGLGEEIREISREMETYVEKIKAERDKADIAIREHQAVIDDQRLHMGKKLAEARDRVDKEKTKGGTWATWCKKYADRSEGDVRNPSVWATTLPIDDFNPHKDPAPEEVTGDPLEALKHLWVELTDNEQAAFPRLGDARGRTGANSAGTPRRMAEAKAEHQAPLPRLDCHAPLRVGGTDKITTRRCADCRTQHNRKMTQERAANPTPAMLAAWKAWGERLRAATRRKTPIKRRRPR